MRGNTILTNYFKWLRNRLKDWDTHVNDTEGVIRKAIDSGHPGYATYKLRDFLGDVVGLGLQCYDNAYGWMYPGSGQPQGQGGNAPGNKPRKNAKKGRGR